MVWPVTDGSGASDVTAAVEFALFTVCETDADAGLALKFTSPLYVAVSVYEAGVGNAMVQEPMPAVSVAVQALEPPSETATVPVMVVGATAAPGATAATDTLIVTD